MSINDIKVFSRGAIGIEEGFVYNSTVDMNYKKITSLADPEFDYDAVNLRTLENYSGGFSSITVVLTGTNKTIIDTSTRGSFIITVTGTSSNSPCATFSISKANSDIDVLPNRTSSSSGKTSNERLDLDWKAGEGIKLFKNGLNYDGDYIVKIV